MNDGELWRACEVLYNELWNGVVGLTPDERMRRIEQALKSQRAAEARRAIQMCNEHHAKDHWYITRLRGRLEQRAAQEETPS